MGIIWEVMILCSTRSILTSVERMVLDRGDLRVASAGESAGDGRTS